MLVYLVASVFKSTSEKCYNVANKCASATHNIYIYISEKLELHNTANDELTFFNDYDNSFLIVNADGSTSGAVDIGGAGVNPDSSNVG